MDAAFLLAVGSFLLTVELFYLQWETDFLPLLALTRRRRSTGKPVLVIIFLENTRILWCWILATFLPFSTGTGNFSVSDTVDKISFFTYSWSFLAYSFSFSAYNWSFLAYSFSFSAYNWSFLAYSRKVRLIRALRDCKQRSLTVSKKAPTVSKQASPKDLASGAPSQILRGVIWVRLVLNACMQPLSIPVWTSSQNLNGIQQTGFFRVPQKEIGKRSSIPFSFLVTFSDSSVTLCSALFCQTPFAALHLRQGEETLSQYSSRDNRVKSHPQAVMMGLCGACWKLISSHDRRFGADQGPIRTNQRYATTRRQQGLRFGLLPSGTFGWLTDLWSSHFLASFCVCDTP